MKKALWLTLGSMLATGVADSAFAYLNHTLVRQSAFSVTGTYTEVSNNGLSMGDYFVNQFTSTFYQRRAIFIDPELKFDYALGYTYHVPHTAARFFMTYDHYHTGKSNDAVGNIVNIEVPSSFFGGPFFVNDRARVDFRSDEFRIGLCELLNFSPRFSLDVNAFFEWDKVRQSLYEAAFDQFFSSGFVRSFVERNTENKVEGWGFGVGTTAHGIPFPRYSHWGVFVGAKTTLLWAKNHYYQSLISEESGSSADYIFNPESSDSLVGKLDINFGIDYCRTILSDLGGFMLEVDLGMRYVNFINALKNGNTYYNPLWPDFSIYGANTGFANDWGRIGPYLTFTIGGVDA